MTETIAAHHKVRVELGTRSYDIEIGAGLLGQAGSYLAPLTRQPRVFVLTDGTVGGIYAGPLEESLSKAGLQMRLKAVSGGEGSKSWAVLGEVLDWLLSEGAGRDDVLVALGGGIVGDLTGLAASLMKRGMTFVQIPTTLLAQVDSSVGGKTAVNAEQGKNLIGAFYQPALVLADTDVLSTLPERERLAGYAEVVKYALIDDPAFFDWLESHGSDVVGLEKAALAEAVAISCRAKARIVSEDERESGVRALLNLGHTFGHALEAVNGFRSSLLHGEAVAAGMALALGYSARQGLMSADDAARAAALLEKSGLVTQLNRLPGGPYTSHALTEAMKQDKKVRAGRVPLILARGLGKAFIQPDADLADVGAFLEEELQRS
ncbi:MAG: 3-dehydroquinate synthase [Henriciella sp.]|jgi:3-dehydroquinate synthase|uniref:3-dehydroquinate synthase n=1 Tax=Henriciella sp. TaxID=1968823 RepID=UPI000C10F5A2|nr:3-dehydroquinate synthase [Henriciella sp.]MAN72547.1 3-dehydroquinate synthase [Henriciella sp.]PHR79460.1 MAG: 3-dehydroquinate synthase [Henriciella sp.]|tara:strand:+ start:138 stop:1268 length:1131 start_codon:yes stop_codon:yes gene_type:complete